MLKNNYNISLAISTYEQAQNKISEIAIREGYFVKKALMEFEAVVQWSLVNVAVEDGLFLKCELEFLLNFTKYIDIFLLSGSSWTKLLSLNGENLKNLIKTVNTGIVNKTNDFSNIFRCLSEEEYFDIEASVLKICIAMAEIDGDSDNSDDYTNEWTAGMKTYYTLTSFYRKSQKQPVIYGFNKDYRTSDVTIKLESAKLNYDPSVCKINFSITNYSNKNIRFWVKDYGIWLTTTEDEIIEEYIQLCNLKPYQTKAVDFFMKESKFNNVLWPAYCSEDEGLDKEDCFSEIVLTITYDFGESTDIGFSRWIIDNEDVQITFDEDWAANTEEPNFNSNSTMNKSNTEELDTSEWNIESILRKEGYTVSQRSNLSNNERQEIIKSVLLRNLMTKQQIIEHIELQISLRKNNNIYDNAISKWTSDLIYIKNDL